MKQRPKLSLSHAQMREKAPPRGFAANAVDGSPAGNQSLEDDGPGQVQGPRPARSAGATLPKRPEWFNAATIVKTLVVVGIAALSIVLLKRRLL